MTSAQIVAGSIANGQKVRTYELTYPRFIHSEIMTHRMFSRNTASSRAIPVNKFVNSLAYVPNELFERLGLNQSGMQAQDIQLTETQYSELSKGFVKYRTNIIEFTKLCQSLDLHKQIINRFIEPLMHITCIVTATDMDNFFAQRCHPAAQPELQSLAFKMLKCEIDFKFNSLYYGQWHLPYVTEQENKDLSFRELRKMSVARVASVSYIKHGEELTKERCDAIYDKLLEGGHWSPFEHVCTPMAPNNKDHYSGNLKGWSMFRKEFMTECRDVTDFQALYNTKPDWIN